MAVLSADGRTTDVGLYHYARSFEAAAKALKGKLPRSAATHPDAPIDHLLIHSIELYLKAYLRSRGMTISQLKNIGHGIPKLGDLFEKNAGHLDDEDKIVFQLLTPENVFGARYIVTGYFQRASPEALFRTAASLHQTVREELRNAGKKCAN